MKVAICVLATALVALALPAQADWFAMGNYVAPNWTQDPINRLNDDGVDGDMLAGDGIFSGLVTADVVAGVWEFKIGNDDWSVSYPNSNVFLETTVDNQEIFFTLNTNSIGDGWFPDQNVVWSDALRMGSSWEITGGAPEIGDWTPGSGAVASMVGGVWEVVVTFTSTTGYIEYKWTADGQWGVQQLGADGMGSNASNIGLDIMTDTYTFKLDPMTGRGWQGQGAVPVEDTSWTRIKSTYVE